MGEIVDLDQEHLRLLRVGYFILAALTGSMSVFSLLYIGMGRFFASGAIPFGGDDAPPRLMGLLFLAVGRGLSGARLYRNIPRLVRRTKPGRTAALDVLCRRLGDWRLCRDGAQPPQREVTV